LDPQLLPFCAHRRQPSANDPFPQLLLYFANSTKGRLHSPVVAKIDTGKVRSRPGDIRFADLFLGLAAR
jgi:hypothetical protein